MNIEQHFPLFFGQMDDMVFLVEWKNNELWYTKVNASAQTKLDFDMIGRKLREVLPSSVFQTLYPFYLKCIETKQPVTYSDLNLFVADLPASETGLTCIEYNNKTYVLAITKNINHLKERVEDYIFLDSLVTNTVDAMLVLDIKGIILKINEAFVQHFGWEACELIGHNWSNGVFIPEKLRIQANKIWESLLKGISVPSMETVRLTKSGEPIQVSISYSPVFNEEKQVVAISMIYRSIEHLKELEEQLEESNEAYKSLFSYHRNAVIMVNKDGIIVNGNDACEQIIGFSKNEIIGFSFLDYITKKLPKQKIEMNGKAIHYDLSTKNANGVALYLNVTHVPIIVKDDLKGMYIIAQDITEQRLAEIEREQLQEQLTFLAYHDSLTELPNRRFMEERLEAAIKEAEQSGKMLALLFLDCDHFKVINDTYGHETGDKLLIAFSKRLTNCIRNEDVVGRIGGDEFVIMLQDIEDMEMVVKVADRLLQSLDQPYAVQGKQFQTTTSIGISTYPDNGVTVKQLFRKADQALYSVKNSGRNGYAFSTQ
ncbi:sensor domain-containing protein [Sutcliffiella rhizosphaerae]|uniref:Diguanylate cyclase n=1 Tax=Sutcliffiella rhizosphaerae TaxID=2880967 RepID=A0ABN8AIC1_9BACI|nr:diguanylate cyclase [Sutcliffiella rhizosphaerae]CAG9623257.1 hypothetical protein BACCIP111883_04053 [Sutcliffiella rhizosphaerae]